MNNMHVMQLSKEREDSDTDDDVSSARQSRHYEHRVNKRFVVVVLLLSYEWDTYNIEADFRREKREGGRTRIHIMMFCRQGNHAITNDGQTKDLSSLSSSFHIDEIRIIKKQISEREREDSDTYNVVLSARQSCHYERRANKRSFVIVLLLLYE